MTEKIRITSQCGICGCKWHDTFVNNESFPLSFETSIGILDDMKICPNCNSNTGGIVSIKLYSADNDEYNLTLRPEVYHD